VNSRYKAIRLIFKVCTCLFAFSPVFFWHPACLSSPDCCRAWKGSPKAGLFVASNSKARPALVLLRWENGIFHAGVPRSLRLHLRFASILGTLALDRQTTMPPSIRQSSLQSVVHPLFGASLPSEMCTSWPARGDGIPFLLPRHRKTLCKQCCSPNKTYSYLIVLGLLTIL